MDRTAHRRLTSRCLVQTASNSLCCARVLLLAAGLCNQCRQNTEIVVLWIGHACHQVRAPSAGARPPSVPAREGREGPGNP